MQAVLLQHPGRAAGKIPAGDCGENGCVVHWFFVVKWERGQAVQNSGGRGQVEQLRKQQRGEAGQEGQGVPARRETGHEEDWSMDCGEVENTKKMDEQRKGCRSNCEISKNSRVCRGTFRAGARKSGNSSCRTLSTSGMIFCRSTRECRRGLKRHKASWIRRETCSRKLLPLRKRCGSSEKKPMLFHQLPRKVDGNRKATAKLEGELRGLQVGEERRGSNASQVVVECCFDMVAEQLFTMGAVQARQYENIFQ